MARWSHSLSTPHLTSEWVEAIAHFIIDPKSDLPLLWEIKVDHLVCQSDSKLSFSSWIFFRVARAGRFEPPFALSQVFINHGFLEVADIEIFA